MNLLEGMEAPDMTAIIMAGAFVIAYIAGDGLVDATREEGGKA